MDNKPTKTLGMSESSPAKTLEMKESKAIAKIVASEEISTPEKPTQLPWRSRVAFSVKEVKEVALGLQKPHKDSAADRRSQVKGSGECDDDDLLAVEEELRSTSSSSDLLRESSKTRSPIKKLPEKYNILVDFFNSMECSIRLLRLKRLLPTFANICSSIQHLTGRRFTYGHLAQLKYILPEVISIKKVLLRDEATCCMKPELQLYLQTDTIESSSKQKEESEFSILRKLFRHRILNFSRDHPQVDDIPEDELPHPFGHQMRLSISPSIARDSTCSAPINSTTDSHNFIATASHVPKSFQRRFSHKTLIPDAEKTALVCFNEVNTKDEYCGPIVSSPIKCATKPAICKKPLFASPARKASTDSQNNCKEDKKVAAPDMCSSPKLSYLDSTPARLASTPARLMTATPEIQTPKRFRPSTAYDTPVKQPEKQSARTKLSFSTPQKGEVTEDMEIEAVYVSDDDDIINLLPETLLQKIRRKERKAEEERKSGAAEAKRRKEIVASLPKVFDMILLIFQSGNRSTITKQELIHKIVSGYFSIVDASEVEQQLKLLQELTPDWISAKMVSTGDLLYSVNKISNLQEIRQRLAEAK